MAVGDHGLPIAGDPQHAHVLGQTQLAQRQPVDVPVGHRDLPDLLVRIAVQQHGRELGYAYELVQKVDHGRGRLHHARLQRLEAVGVGQVVEPHHQSPDAKGLVAQLAGPVVVVVVAQHGHQGVGGSRDQRGQVLPVHPLDMPLLDRHVPHVLHVTGVGVGEDHLPAVGLELTRQGHRLVVDAEDHGVAHLVGRGVCRKVRLPYPLDGELEERRPRELAEHDDRDHHGGELRAKGRELGRDVLGQPEPYPRLGHVGHPRQAHVLGLGPGGPPPGKGADHDAEHPHGEQRQGHGPQAHEGVELQRCPHQREKDEVDHRARVVQRRAERLAIVGVVGHQEARDHAHQKRLRGDGPAQVLL